MKMASAKKSLLKELRAKVEERDREIDNLKAKIDSLEANSQSQHCEVPTESLELNKYVQELLASWAEKKMTSPQVVRALKEYLEAS